METWLESVYSDGSAYFVSSPEPSLGETVKIRLRLYESAPVAHVLLRYLKNGAEHLAEAAPIGAEHGLKWYEAEVKVTQERLQYQFYLVCRDAVYFYTQRGITTYIPDHTYDFVLLANYQQPDWVKDAVFYQIFPERFCNGDPGNDVQNGEYSVNGHPCTHAANWEDAPLPFRQGYGMDFHGGDLAGIQEKIPYLKSLGVTCIYLNPIFTAPSTHKYDCIDYFHVDPHFGGDEALASLSKALHENGMRLILDISINHTGADHKWFNRSGQFFDPSVGAYHNPEAKEREYYFFQPGTNRYVSWADVESLPALNYTSQALREIIYAGQDAVLRKWLRPPYSIDGWRFDVADVFAKNDDIQLSHELWPAIRQAIREENPQAYILAEDWGDCAPYLQGDEWDSPMNYFGCGRVIRQFVGLPDLFMERNPLLRQIPYKMTAQDVRSRITQHLAKIPFALQQNQFNLIDSHDVPRLHNYAQVHPQEYRGAVMLQFTLLGAPSIYYGDEAGIDGGTAGDEGFRYPMPWSRDLTAAPQYALHKTLIDLRRDHPALTAGGMKFLYAQGYTLALARFTPEEAYVTVVSTDEETARIRLPLGAIGGSVPEERDVFGNALDYEILDSQSVCLTVPAHTSYLFACKMR